MDYPLSFQRELTLPTSVGEISAEVNIRRGVFCLPIDLQRGRVALGKRSADAPSFPNCWNCFGGGLNGEELNEELALGREFKEESRCAIANISGQVGRDLIQVFRPREVGKPIVVDIAKAFAVDYEGQLELTEESREVGWFNGEELSKLGNSLVGMEVEPVGRTARFASWGAALAAGIVHSYELTPRVDDFFGQRLVPSRSIHLTPDERNLYRVRSEGSKRLISVWRVPDLKNGGKVVDGELENVL